MALPGRLGALDERPFRLLWIGQAASAVGDSMSGIALAFAVLGLGGSAGDLGLVLAALLTSRVVFLLAGGVWADRLPRRVVMLAADAVRAGAQGGVGLLLLAGRAEIWHLGVAAAVSGLASAFFLPASSGLVPEVVSSGRLQQANALMALSRNVTDLFGPAVSGALVAIAGPGWVFLVDAGSYVASAATLALLAVPRAAQLELPQSFLGDLRAGWRELTSRTWLWVSLVVDSVINVGMAAFYVLGPVVAAEELGGAGDWGLIVSGGAVGGLVGSLAALRFRPRRPLLLAYALMPLAALQLFALVPPAPVALIVAASVVTYVSISLANTVWETVFQEHVPRTALSRVSSFDWMISLVLRPVAFALVGPAVVLGGRDTVLIGAAALIVVACGAALAVPSVRALSAAPPPDEPVGI
jgi:MFS family permease